MFFTIDAFALGAVACTIVAQCSFFSFPLFPWLPHMTEEQKQSSGVTHPFREGGLRATRDDEHRAHVPRGAVLRCTKAAQGLLWLKTSVVCDL